MGTNLLPDRKSITVVIPNFNGRYLLEKNLPSVYQALRLSGVDYEVIISDDCSTDGSADFIRTAYPLAILIESTQNSGFSTTINKGIGRASCDLILLLNSDIRLDATYFDSQLSYFDHANTFGVMGKIMTEDTLHVSEACKYPLRSLFKINDFTDVEPAGGRSCFTYYLSGANALVCREKLQLLGGFDEVYSPFYQEDLDLSIRAWKLGWNCHYEPAAVCYHEVSVTIQSYNKKRTIQVINARNKIILHYLHLGPILRWCWLFTQAASLLIRWAIGQDYFYPGAWLFIKRFGAVNASLEKFAALRKNYRRWSLHEVKSKIRASLDDQR